MTIKLLGFLVVLCSAHTVYSQWEKQTAEEVKTLTSSLRDAYQKENYRIDFQKNIYLAEGDTAFQHESGQLYKGPGLDYAIYSDELTLIQQGGLKIVFYPRNNSVYLMDPDSTMQVADFTALTVKFEDCDYFKRNEGDLIVLKAVNRLPSETKATEMYIRKGQLLKLRVYFAPGNYVQTSQGDESIEEPYMEVMYSASQQLTPQDLLMLSTEKYVYTDQGRYHLRKTSGSNYQLVDLRAPKSNTTNR